MSYCLNPKCKQPSHSENANSCFCVNDDCGWPLILPQGYRVIQPLGEGGIGKIFEIDNNGTRKVLKVLLKNHPLDVNLFKREADVLSKLRHEGIPKVERDGYFIFPPEGTLEQLHCLVMEKIEGVDLETWLEERGNQPIAEERAIAWLFQLLDILEKLHEKDYFHRDIKPSNIMITPDEKLILIDFGTVRQVSNTYLIKIGTKRDVTVVVTPGYTPPEQNSGRALPQSDFFALGCTFIHLLTGKHPTDFELELNTGQLLWRDGLQISQPLADLLDDLIAPFPGKRPQTVEIIRQRLKNVKQGVEKGESPISILPEEESSKKNDRPLLRLRGWQIILLTSLLATSLVAGVREMGWLQALELPALDWLMRSRPLENPDRRILLVKITEADIQAQNNKQQFSLSNNDLLLALQQLENWQPRTIGLTIYRDFPIDPNLAQLAAKLRQNSRLIAVCEVGGTKDYPGIPAPKEIPEIQRIGFTDAVRDSDGILRRHLLAMAIPKTSLCQSDKSFSLQIARRYLKPEGIELKLNSQGDFELGNVIFKTLEKDSGVYRNLDHRGHQIMLNYRNSKQIAAEVTLADVLQGKVNPDLIKDRIVLIGTVSKSVKSYVPTPINYAGSSLREMPPVVIQAHQASEIISAVLDKRPLLSFWSKWNEAGWIFGWSVVGGMLVLYWRSPRSFSYGSAAIATLFGLSLTFLIKGGNWIPVVPAFVALISCKKATKQLIRIGTSRTALAMATKTLIRIGTPGAALATLYGSCLILLNQGSLVPLIPPALALVTSGGIVFLYTTLQKRS